MAIREGFVRPSEQSSFKKPIALKDGNNIFRLLPPVARVSPDGSWYQYQRQHWGYGVKDKDGNFQARPFACVQEMDFKTKKVTVPCAECDLIEKNKNALAEADLKSKGRPPAERKALLQPLWEFSNLHNLDRKYVMNVKSGDGEFSYIRLPSTVYKDMKVLIKKLRERDIDPFDLDGGVWFNAVRTGEKKKTEYHTEIVMENVKLPNGQKAQVEKSAALTEEEVNAALSEAQDLRNMLTVISPESIQKLVDSEGSFEIAEAIFGAAQQRAAPAAAATEDDTPAEDNEMPVSPPTIAEEVRKASAAKPTPVTKPAPTPTKAATPPPADFNEDDLDALFQ
jgi:hypothetical protein